MVTKLFAIYDSKAKAFRFPMFQPSSGEAIRSFGDAANDDQNLIGKHPDDFALYEIAEFDDLDAKLTALSVPVNLGMASVYKK